MFTHTVGGWAHYEYYRPSAQQFSDDVVAARPAKSNPASRAPIPHGWDFDIENSPLLIDPSAADYVRFAKAYGFAAHVNDSTSGDAPSAFAAIVVLKPPFRLGGKGPERKTRWAFARANAFAAKAVCPEMKPGNVFAPPPGFSFGRGACVVSGFQSIAIGDAVTGAIKLTPGEYKNTHLDVVLDVVFGGGCVLSYRWPALNVVSDVLFGVVLSYRIAGSP